MITKHGGVVINEVEVEPLSEYVIEFLTAQKKESPFLDFKYVIPVDKDSDFPELAKDMFAFSNYGGGWILVGWEEHKKNQFVPVGLPEEYNLEPAVLQQKFESLSSEPLALGYTEFTKDFTSVFLKSKDDFKIKIGSISQRFAIIFVPPSYSFLTPKKDGKYLIQGKERIVFKQGDLFYRRGSQSIKPSNHEIQLIKKRIEKENYRISFLSGEPDEIEEKIYSNIFEFINFPKFVYSAEKRDYDNASVKMLLKQEGVFPEFYFKFKEWNKRIVTFENLFDNSNPYRKLVNADTIIKEPIGDWIKDDIKNPIIVEILNRELRHHAIGKHLYIYDKRTRLYYPTETDSRQEKWRSRYRNTTVTVAAKMYAEQLQRSIYWHTAFFPEILQINDKFYLRILPTFLITEDGKKPISDFLTGTIITRLSYDKYNSSYLNNILFWIHQLGESKDIAIKDYITISSKPVQLKSSLGIIFDIPSSEFKLDISEEDDPIDDENGEIDEF